jgi:hypothetical protein
MSSVSVLLYNVQEFQPQEKPIPMVKTSVVWFYKQWMANDNGVNFDKVRWYLIDEGEWIKMMTSYVKVVSGINDTKLVKTDWWKRKIVNKGVKVDGKLWFL